jgi:hypothetical protein
LREITEHRVDGDLPQNQLLVIAADERGAGGANHRYVISGYSPGQNPAWRGGDPGITAIVFQNGGIKEAGLNGITHEVLLAIVADRLRGFQDGPFSSLENGHALDCVEEALDFLKIRTKGRIARGVEGEQKP